MRLFQYQISGLPEKKQSFSPECLNLQIELSARVQGRLEYLINI